MKLRPLTRNEVRAIDQQCINEYRLSGLVLMENAGRNATDVILKRFPNIRHVAIVCGKGNNAGDGFVIARHLELAGIKPTVVLTVDKSNLSSDANTNFGVIEKSGIEVLTFDELKARRFEWADCDLVVDALLGTGLQGCPRDPFARAISFVNSAREESVPVVSIDIPSGMDCDTGSLHRSQNGAAPGSMGEPLCVQAVLTITFVSEKTGFQFAHAQKMTGQIAVAGIGAPAKLLRQFAIENDSLENDRR